MFIQGFYSNIHTINTFISQFTTVFQETRIVVTSKLIFNVLHVPKVAHLNYLSAPYLCSISRDKLASRFCEHPMSWNDTPNFTIHDFAKGPRILNMVMTFVLTPRSHYNTITQPRAHFLFSLLDGLSIEFPSHMILSMIDIYRDTATRDKLIFLSDITRILTHMHIPIPFPLSLRSWVLLAMNLCGGALHSWWPRLNGLIRSLLLLSRKRLLSEL